MWTCRWSARVPTASALLFDLGVFGLVVGATVLMLIALAHQSIRKLRAARTDGRSARGEGVMELVLAHRHRHS